MVDFVLPFLLVVWHSADLCETLSVMDDVGTYLCWTGADTHLSNTEQASILLLCRPWHKYLSGATAARQMMNCHLFIGRIQLF